MRLGPGTVCGPEEAGAAPFGDEGPLLQRLRLMAGVSAGASGAQAAYFESLYADILQACSDPRGYLAATFYVPSEVPAALGISWLCSEPVVGAAASLPDAPAALSDSVRLLDLPPGLCGYQRLFLGLIARGLLPPPRAFAAASSMCDDAWKMYEVAAWRLRRPFFLLDVPHLPGPEATRYLAHQLRRLAEFLASTFGCRLRRDRVEEAVTLSNRALHQKRRLDRARRLRPGAVDSAFGLRLFTLYCGFGGRRCLEVYRRLNSELAALPQQYPRGVQGPELRLIWLGLMPLFIPSLTRYLERKWRVKVVYEELGGFDWPELDAEELFERLADKLWAQPFLGPARARAQAAAQMAQEFAADAAIHLSYPGCRALPPAVPELRSALAAVGVPLLDVSAEVVDRSRYSAAATLLALDAFMEQVGARPRPPAGLDRAAGGGRP
ncbi:MAG: 2-hydroxyacyl-CoA dehydratase family protein [Acetobacteraceae bacterium]|nr:2-hydroxyacyl-CoA dehydratase family protein [Acetobacteraceae bacterium]